MDRLEYIEALVKIAEKAEIHYTIHLDENLNIADFNPLVSDAYLETVRRSMLRKSYFRFAIVMVTELSR